MLPYGVESGAPGTFRQIVWQDGRRERAYELLAGPNAEPESYWIERGYTTPPLFVPRSLIPQYADTARKLYGVGGIYTESLVRAPQREPGDFLVPLFTAGFGAAAFSAASASSAAVDVAAYEGGAHLGGAGGGPTGALVADTAAFEGGAHLGGETVAAGGTSAASAAQTLGVKAAETLAVPWLAKQLLGNSAKNDVLRDGYKNEMFPKQQAFSRSPASGAPASSGAPSFALVALVIAIVVALPFLLRR